MIAHFGKDDFLNNGYTVTTTIDWTLQKKAEDEVKKGVLLIDKRQGYKGALEKLSDENIVTNLSKIRQDIYKQSSNFFTFYKDGTTKNEFVYEEGEMESLLSMQDASKDDLKERQKCIMSRE